ncbi:hypothetical protein CS022_19050 [Veronia nyctiphanis]|uniref:Uncharacterized protein n=1 Tax=Veronia nyctiphanis TaxID=1278244 RepID=A0A4Q0YMA9_9GAMM|nr:hypothetical protein [Veronia nyctiphanis]RXJ71866.1 hypothetical protein CS022_19050 [Veronia nyctiphanis]
MDLLDHIILRHIGLLLVLIPIAFYIVRGMYRLVVWGKRMPKGAFVFLTVFPVLSLFPIPPQEISKLERIRQEQVKEEDESGDPEDNTREDA